MMDLDWETVEKVATVVALLGVAEVCTEVAATLRDQRKRPREIEAAPVADARAALAGLVAAASPPAQVFMLTPAPAQLPRQLLP